MVEDGWHTMLSEQVYVENGFVRYGKHVPVMVD